MLKITKTAIALVIATLALAALTSSASGAGLRFGTSNTTGVARNLTLRDSALGNVLSNVTLTATITTSITCPTTGTVLVQKGGVTRAAVSITSPAGVTASVSPFLIYERCINGVVDLLTSGLPRLYFLDVRFQLIGVPGNPTYTGSLVGILGASPATTITGVSSSFTSNLGTTASFSLPWSFTLSPALVWALVP